MKLFTSIVAMVLATASCSPVIPAIQSTVASGIVTAGHVRNTNAIQSSYNANLDASVSVHNDRMDTVHERQNEAREKASKDLEMLKSVFGK